jgi:hypothetical protein
MTNDDDVPQVRPIHMDDEQEEPRFANLTGGGDDELPDAPRFTSLGP